MKKVWFDFSCGATRVYRPTMTGTVRGLRANNIVIDDNLKHPIEKGRSSVKINTKS